MVCETKKEAARVAYFGAIKMDAQGYRYNVVTPFELVEGGTLRNGEYLIISPAGQPYTVTDNPFQLDSEPRKLECSCKFYAENRAHGVCKHTTRVEWLLRDREQQMEEDAWEDRIAAEAELRMGAECHRYGCVTSE